MSTDLAAVQGCKKPAACVALISSGVRRDGHGGYEKAPLALCTDCFELTGLTAILDGVDADHVAACGHTVTDRQDLHWSADIEDEVCPDCCQECNQ